MRNYVMVVAMGRAMSNNDCDDKGFVDSAPDLFREQDAEGTRHRVGENTEAISRKFLYQPSAGLHTLSGQFIGAAIDVHSHLGPGFTEVIYQRALCRELVRRGIPYESEVAFDVVFKDEVIGSYRIDLVIDNCMIVELKAVERINSVHVAQTISYLRATQIGLGLIVNFNVQRLRDGVRRVVW
ncbi:MAG: GxxExxY protein [Kofleriaceae bacterium]